MLTIRNWSLEIVKESFLQPTIEDVNS
jgi:hypothetical protein